MKDGNIMGKIEYIAESIFWSLISMIWYKKIFFRCLPKLTYGTSILVLWSMLLVSEYSGYFFRKKRTAWSVYASFLFPYGLYTIGSYWRILQGRIVFVFLIATVLSILIGIFVMTRRINPKRNMKRVIVKRLRRCVAMQGNIITVAMTVIMVPLLFRGIFGIPLFKPTVEAEISTETEEQTISSNIDTILKLQEEEWQLLSMKNKLNVLQCVANIEAYYLGISNELKVGAANLPKYTLACYSEDFHTIYINLEHLENDSADEILNSCCHEAYHSYQYRLVDAYNEAPEELQELLIYNNAAQYADEFAEYVDGNEDFFSYYSQQCEEDARNYAENAVDYYYSRINTYLEEGLESILDYI